MGLFQILKRRHRKQNFKPVVLITGCSSGIGLELAKLLNSKNKYRLIVTSRDSSLERVKAIFKETESLIVKGLDVTKSNQRKNLIKEIEQIWQGIDILVNNAGISYRAVVEHMPEKDELLQIQTNYLGPMALIRLVIPYMRKKGRGKIINVSSVAGMVAMPTMSSYSASKYALEGATESLWYEMRPLGINVSLVQPGFIKSDGFKHVYYSKISDCAEKTEDETELYNDYYKNMTPFITKMMNNSFYTAKDIAKTIDKVIKTESPLLRIPATIDASIFYYVRRMVPRRFLHKFLFWCLPNSKNWARSYSNSRSNKGSHGNS